MSLMNGIRDMLGRKRRIDKISAEEIRREKIRVEQMEKRVSRDVDTLEARKQELFLKGKDEPGQRQRLAAARKIRELDARARGKSRQLAFFNKHLRILDGLLQIKENTALLEELKLGSLVSGMALPELTEYVEQATVEGQFEIEKFTSLVAAIEGAAGTGEGLQEDSDVLAIMTAMEEARAAEEAGRGVSVDEAMQHVDEILETKADMLTEAQSA